MRRILPFEFAPLSLASLSSCAVRDDFVGAIVLVQSGLEEVQQREALECTIGKEAWDCEELWQW